MTMRERSLRSLGIPTEWPRRDFQDCVLIDPPSDAGTIIIPVALLDGSTPPGRWVVYRLGFVVEGHAPEDFKAQMDAGYIGITRRGLLARWREHSDTARRGDGFALHHAWRIWLSQPEWPGTCAAMILATADTLDEAYRLEEVLVDQYTLLPRGLNVIPGGHAGIRFLHKIGATKNKKLSPEQRDEILCEIERTQRVGPRTHYRRGHLRTLPAGTLTWVRACFVALAGVSLAA